MEQHELAILIEALGKQAAEADDQRHANPKDTDYWQGAADGVKFGANQVRELERADLGVPYDDREGRIRVVEQSLLGIAKELRDYGKSAEEVSFSAPNSRYYIGLRDGYAAAARVLTLSVLGGMTEPADNEGRG